MFRLLGFLFFGLLCSLVCLPVFAFQLNSSAFEHGGDIPSNYTCDGKDVSPPLHWAGTPKGTESFVIVVHDPDAPVGDWIHWVVYNIPRGSISIPPNIKPNSQTFFQTKNSWKRQGYGGPCPPSGLHHYIFTLYALDYLLPLNQGASQTQVKRAMQGHLLGLATLEGVYSRK